MKISVFTVCTPEFNVEQTVNTIKELGYDGVEWRVGPAAPSEKPQNYNYERRYWSYNLSTLDINTIDESIHQVKDICDKKGIEMCSLSTNLDPWDEANIDKVLKASGSVSCRNVRLWISNYNGRENYNQLFEKNLRQFRVLVKMAEKYNVRIMVETHMNNLIPSASAAYRFVSNFDPKYLGVIYDPGNMVREGFENYKLGLELLGEYVAHVHLKNGIWKRECTDCDGIEVWKPEWSPLKKGIADIKGFINALKDTGYGGYLSFEDFSNEDDTYSKLKSNIEYIRQLL